MILWATSPPGVLNGLPRPARARNFTFCPARLGLEYFSKAQPSPKIFQRPSPVRPAKIFWSPVRPDQFCTHKKMHKTAGNPRLLQKCALIWKHFVRSSHITCKITQCYNFLFNKHIFFLAQFGPQNFPEARPGRKNFSGPAQPSPKFYGRAVCPAGRPARLTPLVSTPPIVPEKKTYDQKCNQKYDKKTSPKRFFTKLGNFFDPPILAFFLLLQ